MICPFCREKDTSVVDSRPTEDGTAIRRRRVCSCGGGQHGEPEGRHCPAPAAGL